MIAFIRDRGAHLKIPCCLPLHTRRIDMILPTQARVIALCDRMPADIERLPGESGANQQP